MEKLPDELLHQLRKRASDPSKATDEHQDEGWDPPFTHVAQPPLNTAALNRAEDLLGFALPLPLRQIYTEVGNGDFGPGYGLLPLLDQDSALGAEPLVLLHQGLVADGWPPHLLPFCYWGCTIYSVLNLQNGQVGILDLEGWDPSGQVDLQVWWQKDTLSSWFEAWLQAEDLFFDLEGP